MSISPELRALFQKFKNAHFTSCADEYREGASDRSVAKNYDASEKAEAEFLAAVDALTARLAEVERERDAWLIRAKQYEKAHELFDHDMLALLQRCQNGAATCIFTAQVIESALAARDALVVTLREALESTRDNLWDWVFSRVEGSKRIKVDAASSQCHKADQALALTPSSPANCAVVPVGEMAELRRDKERLELAADVISSLAKNLTNDDGTDPETWWLELTAEEANLVKLVAKQAAEHDAARSAGSEKP